MKKFNNLFIKDKIGHQNSEMAENGLYTENSSSARLQAVRL